MGVWKSVGRGVKKCVGSKRRCGGEEKCWGRVKKCVGE